MPFKIKKIRFLCTQILLVGIESCGFKPCEPQPIEKYPLELYEVVKDHAFFLGEDTFKVESGCHPCVSNGLDNYSLDTTIISCDVKIGDELYYLSYKSESDFTILKYKKENKEM